MDLREGDSAARHLRFAVPFVAGPGQGVARENLYQGIPLLARQLGQWAGRVDTGLLDESVREPVGKLPADERPYGPRAAPPEAAIPLLCVRRCPPHVDLLRVAAVHEG